MVFAQSINQGHFSQYTSKAKAYFAESFNKNHQIRVRVAGKVSKVSGFEEVQTLNPGIGAEILLTPQGSNVEIGSRFDFVSKKTIFTAYDGDTVIHTSAFNYSEGLMLSGSPTEMTSASRKFASSLTNFLQRVESKGYKLAKAERGLIDYLLPSAYALGGYQELASTLSMLFFALLMVIALAGTGSGGGNNRFVMIGAIMTGALVALKASEVLEGQQI